MTFIGCWISSYLTIPASLIEVNSCQLSYSHLMINVIVRLPDRRQTNSEWSLCRSRIAGNLKKVIFRNLKSHWKPKLQTNQCSSWAKEIKNVESLQMDRCSSRLWGATARCDNSYSWAFGYNVNTCKSENEEWTYLMLVWPPKSHTWNLRFL